MRKGDGAHYEITIDGGLIAMIRNFALEGAKFLKVRNPKSTVAVRDNADE